MASERQRLIQPPVSMTIVVPPFPSWCALIAIGRSRCSSAAFGRPLPVVDRARWRFVRGDLVVGEVPDDLAKGLLLLGEIRAHPAGS